MTCTIAAGVWPTACSIGARVTVVALSTESTYMNAIRMFAIALIIGGVLALGYGGFTYTKDTNVIKLGSIELSVKEKQTVNVPIWAGIAAIVAGGLMLAFGSKKG